MVVSFTEWWAARLCGPCKCAPVCLQSHLQQRKNSRFSVVSPPLSIGAGLRRPGEVAPLPEAYFCYSTFLFGQSRLPVRRVHVLPVIVLLSWPAAQSKPQVVLQGYRGFFCFLQMRSESLQTQKDWCYHTMVQICRNISGIKWNIFDIASKTQCGIILA